MTLGCPGKGELDEQGAFIVSCPHINACKENFIEEKSAHRKALYEDIKQKPDNPQGIYQGASRQYVKLNYP